MASYILLLISLGLILLAAEGFTNGVEAVGRRYSLSQAVVGSILSAIGTALPETVLPFVAILSGSSRGAGKEIGVGAILGAPFMLSTVAFALVGLAVLVSWAHKRRAFRLTIEHAPVRRDLTFFIIMYAGAVFLPLLAGRAAAVPLVLLLLAGYTVYVRRTSLGESAAIEHLQGLHLHEFFQKIEFLKSGESPRLGLILFQIAVTLAVMVSGARLFVDNLERIALHLGMDPLLFALVLAPVATELPEKFNSVTWVLKGRDTLAVGNITGAMVFQSVFPVTIGLLFTEWRISGMAIFSAVLALVSAGIVLGEVRLHRRISPLTLILGGVFYLIYLAVLALSVTHP
jgi:cation:H+ antiporter